MKILDNEGKEIEKLDFGIVEAGKFKEYDYTLYNDDEVEVIDIEVKIAHKEVEVLNYPNKLGANTKGNLKVKWSPSLTVKQGLQTVVKLTGKRLYK